MRHKLFYLFICLEAWLELSICKLIVLTIPFERYAKKMGIVQCETLQKDNGECRASVNAIHRALHRVPPCLPWKSLCLDQAMAAQRMLARRGLSSTFYFGLSKEKDASLIAHAWLRCGNQKIVGYQTKNVYTIVGCYAWLA